MAIPAALFIKRFSYKQGILLGLLLYAVGCILFLPAGQSLQFAPFLLAYFIMTCGLSFLETSANPYILSMGDERTATRRLNFAQAFNPLGSITGMLVAKEFILARLNPASESERIALQQSNPEQFLQLARADLQVIVLPYLLLGIFVALVLVVFFFAPLREAPGEQHRKLEFFPTLRRLLRNPAYVHGVIAQTFYVGVQIMCWTFIIQYATNEIGISKAEAQGWNILAMVLFVSFRFICTYLLKFIPPGPLLAILATLGGLLTLGTIFLPPWHGLYCLVAVSACMSLMFPTIYGIALRGLGDDAKLGSAGLILAIGGGSIMPPLQGAIMDLPALGALSSTRLSFVLPLLCFVVLAHFGWRTARVYSPMARMAQEEK